MKLDTPAARRILCIRHGESTFNAAYRETGRDPLHFDAPLTPHGRAQIRTARPVLRAIPFELVVTSPLTRALQTTQLAFEDHPARPRILVDLQHREHGLTSADVGRPPTVLAAEFPAFTFDHLPATWWYADGEPDERGVHMEPDTVFAARVATFRDWLDMRPERVIAVVGHGTFFLHLLGRWLENGETVPWRPEL